MFLRSSCSEFQDRTGVDKRLSPVRGQVHTVEVQLATTRGGATFTEVGGTNHGERSEPENFFVVPPKRGYKYHFAPSNRGYKIIAKITRRLVQKCTTWFRSTNFTSCSPQNHCTVIFYYGTRYWPISRFCHIFLSPFTVFNAFP